MAPAKFPKLYLCVDKMGKSSTCSVNYRLRLFELIDQGRPVFCQLFLGTLW
jgi:hypothetical protein